MSKIALTEVKVKTKTAVVNIKNFKIRFNLNFSFWITSPNNIPKGKIRKWSLYSFKTSGLTGKGKLSANILKARTKTGESREIFLRNTRGIYHLF